TRAMMRARAASARPTMAVWALMSGPSWWVRSGGKRHTTPPPGTTHALSRLARNASRAVSSRGSSWASHSRNSAAEMMPPRRNRADAGSLATGPGRATWTAGLVGRGWALVLGGAPGTGTGTGT